MVQFFLAHEEAKRLARRPRMYATYLEVVRTVIPLATLVAVLLTR